MTQPDPHELEQANAPHGVNTDDEKADADADMVEPFGPYDDDPQEE